MLLVNEQLSVYIKRIAAFYQVCNYENTNYVFFNQYKSELRLALTGQFGVKQS